MYQYMYYSICQYVSIVCIIVCILSPGMPVLFWFSRRMTLWGSISFNLAVFINLIIAFFYPYDSGQGTSSISTTTTTTLDSVLVVLVLLPL